MMKPYWLKLKPEEIEALIEQLAKKGLPEPKIGLVLRDSYGIPSVKAVLGKKISEVLRAKGIKREPADLEALRKKAKALERHLERHRKDFTAKRGLQLTQAKIAALERYYKRKRKWN